MGAGVAARGAWSACRQLLPGSVGTPDSARFPRSDTITHTIVILVGSSPVHTHTTPAKRKNVSTPERCVVVCQYGDPSVVAHAAYINPHLLSEFTLFEIHVPTLARLLLTSFRKFIFRKVLVQFIVHLSEVCWFLKVQRIVTNFLYFLTRVTVTLWSVRVYSWIFAFHSEFFSRLFVCLWIHHVCCRCWTTSTHLQNLPI